MTVLRRFALLFSAALGLGLVAGCDSQTTSSPPPPPTGAPPPVTATETPAKGGPISNPSLDSARVGTSPKK